MKIKPTIWTTNKGVPLYRFRRVVNGVKLRKCWTLDTPPEKINADIAQLMASAHGRASPLPLTLAQNATIESMITLWIAHLEARCSLPKSHDRTSYSPLSFEKVDGAVREFRRLYGGMKRDQTWEAVIEYRMRLGKQITLGKLKPSSVNTRMASLKSFAQWAYEEELLDAAPRKFRKRTAGFIDNRKPKTVSLEDAATLFKNARPYLQLNILTALNTGAGAGELKTKTGKNLVKIGDAFFLVGERNKTGIEFRYRLWPEVVERLTTEPGSDKPLFPSGYKKPVAHHGTLNRGLYRLETRLGWKHRVSFYAFRHLGATMIEAIDPAATSLYLAHKIEGMRSVYVSREGLYARLDVATEKLREQVMAAIVPLK